ncbi:MAG TPA: hypothetical protein VHE11_01535, partial [Steroidobacteraceae bacterium]|nr:hypothetical protein [Steroidobacteraceae bacterium]
QLDPRILPDMGVRVSFLQPAAAQAGAAAGGKLPAGTVWVPASAIVQRGGRAIVFVVQGDRAREASITPGASQGDLRAVQGITSGTAVVQSPPARLRDGARITVKPESAS